MITESHGGECCGITHIYGFGNGNDWVSVDNLKSEIIQVMFDHRERYERNTGRQMTSHVYEAVLTDGQLSQNGNIIAKALKEMGWKLVTRAMNSNTSNIINIFHYNTGTLPHPYPISWENV